MLFSTPWGRMKLSAHARNSRFLTDRRRRTRVVGDRKARGMSQTGDQRSFSHCSIASF